MTTVAEGINQFCTGLETAFNVAGCIPFVGTLSGAARAVLGKVQAVSGGVFALGAFACFAVALAVKANPKYVHEFKAGMHYGSKHLMHGVLNMIRGTFEFALGYATYGIASPLLLIPNLANYSPFAPVYVYDPESVRRQLSSRFA